MANVIKIKNSVQAGKAPKPADLDRAELAINLADKKIYTKDANDAIIELGGGGSGGGGPQKWINANNGAEFADPAQGTGSNSIAIGEKAKTSADNTIVIGTDSNTSSTGSFGVHTSIVIGKSNTIEGTNSHASQSIVIGTESHIKASSASCTRNIIIGKGAGITSAHESITLGAKATVDSSERSIAIGSGATCKPNTSGNGGSIAIGSNVSAGGSSTNTKATIAIATRKSTGHNSDDTNQIFIMAEDGGLRVKNDGKLETTGDGGDHWTSVGSGMVYVGKTFKGTPKEGDLWLQKPHLGKIDITKTMPFITKTELVKNMFFNPLTSGHPDTTWQNWGLQNTQLTPNHFIYWDGSAWKYDTDASKFISTQQNPHDLGTFSKAEIILQTTGKPNYPDKIFSAAYNNGITPEHPNVRGSVAALQDGDFFNITGMNSFEFYGGVGLTELRNKALWTFGINGVMKGQRTTVHNITNNTYFIWNKSKGFWFKAPPDFNPGSPEPPPEFIIYKNGKWEKVGSKAGPTHFIKTTDPTVSDGNDGDIWFKII